MIGGDCNDEIPKALKRLSPRAWAPTFAFVDPNGMEAEWRTLEALADFRAKEKTKVELFLLFAGPDVLLGFFPCMDLQFEPRTKRRSTPCTAVASGVRSITLGSKERSTPRRHATSTSTSCGGGSRTCSSTAGHTRLRSATEERIAHLPYDLCDRSLGGDSDHEQHLCEGGGGVPRDARGGSTTTTCH